MKLYYTDANKQKKLIIESDDLNAIAEAAVEDGKKKFIQIKGLKLVSNAPEMYAFMSEGQESGYTIEE